MRYLLLFGGQCLSFLVVVVNMRAIATNRWWVTAVTDFTFCLINFLLVKMITEASQFDEAIVYAAGGAVGSLTAMRLTGHWKHQ